MAAQGEPEQSYQSLADRITDRITPVEDTEMEMELDPETETDRRQALLDGPLEESTVPMGRMIDQQLELDTEEGTGLMGLAKRIAKNRLYTMDETAPDAPDTRVPEDVLEKVDLEFLSWAVGESPIRDNALHLSGTPLAHLSTDKIFHYVTNYAPAPLGVEWISDNRLVLVFHDGREAKVAISLLAKTGFDPYEPNNDDPLELRAAKPVPRKLLPLPEQETSSATDVGKHRSSNALEPTDLLFNPKRDLVPVKKTNDEDLPVGLRAGARLDIRYAMESDVKARTAAKDSEWYKKHGRTAGKGVNPLGGSRHRQQPYGGRRRSASPGDRRERGEGGTRRPRKTQVDLDAELDAMRNGTFVAPMTAGIEAADESTERRRDGGRGNGRRDQREQRSQADLDAELEAFLADRGEERGERGRVDRSNRFE